MSRPPTWSTAWSACSLVRRAPRRSAAETRMTPSARSPRGAGRGGCSSSPSPHPSRRRRDPAFLPHLSALGGGALPARRSGGAAGERGPGRGDFQYLVGHPERRSTWRPGGRPSSSPWSREPGGEQRPWSGPLDPLPLPPPGARRLAGRTLGLPPLGILYLCRLVNLWPAWPWPDGGPHRPVLPLALRLLALDPMALFLRSSTSPDAAIDAAALLLVATALAAAAASAGNAGKPGRDRGWIALLLTLAERRPSSGSPRGPPIAAARLVLLPRRTLGRPAAAGAMIAAVLALALSGAAFSGWEARRGYTPLRVEVRADPTPKRRRSSITPCVSSRSCSRHRAPGTGLRHPVRGQTWAGSTPLCPPPSSWSMPSSPRPRPGRRLALLPSRTARTPPRRGDHRRHRRRLFASQYPL